MQRFVVRQMLGNIAQTESPVNLRGGETLTANSIEADYIKKIAVFTSHCLGVLFGHAQPFSIRESRR